MASDDAPADRRGQARQRIEQLTDQIAEERAADATEEQLAAALEAARDRTISLSPAAFWAMLGVTLASGAATAALGAVTLVRHNEFLDLYRDDPESSQLQEQGTNLALATNIMLGVTAFLALTTLVFALDTDWERGRSDREENVSLVPSVGPGGGNLSLIGRF
jgi:cytochrome P450